MDPFRRDSEAHVLCTKHTVHDKPLDVEYRVPARDQDLADVVSSTMSSSNSLSSHTYRPRTDYDRSDYAAGQALVTVVNDPRADANRQAWGWLSRPDTSWQDPPPSVDPLKYPSVSRADLQGYLRIIRGHHEQFLQDRQSLEEGQRQQQLLFEGTGPGHVQGEGLAKALAAVPAQFFQEDFSLSRPEIFQSVCDCDEEGEIQERLEKNNGLLDIVETQLMREISSRSQSIFKAASSLHDLNSTLCSTLSHIRSLRERISGSDAATYSRALVVLRLQRRRRALQATVEGLKAVEEVQASKGALQCLLDNQDFAAALELLANMRHDVDLQIESGLRCFRDLPARLADTASQVEVQLCQDFGRLGQADDVQHLLERAIAEAPAMLAANSAAGNSSGTALDERAESDVSIVSSSSLQPFIPGSILAAVRPGAAGGTQPSESDDLLMDREQLHDRLLPLVVGLFRAQQLLGAVQALREQRCQAVKAIIKEISNRMLPLLLDADENNFGGGGEYAGGHSSGGAVVPDVMLSDQLQMLTPAGFMQLLLVTARVVEAYMAHTFLMGSLVEEVVRGLRGGGVASAGAVHKETLNTLLAMNEVAQGRWVKMLSARTVVHTRLKLYEFQQLIRLSEGFGSLPEACGCKAGSGPLRAAIAAQCKAYVEAMHGRCVTQLQHLLEAEQWVSAEVPASFQAIVDRLVSRCQALSDGAVDSGSLYVANDAPLQRRGGGFKHSDSFSRMGETDSRPGEASGRSNGTHVNGLPTQPQGPSLLQLQGRRFHCVNSVLILLKVLEEYLALYDVVPAFGADIAQRTLELLRTYNEQTYKLVLGAGALRTAGLKSISAKHLALSCQGLNLLLTLQPLLRSALINLVPIPRRALLTPDFNHLNQDLMNHMDEIHSKLVEIMQDRLIVAAKQLMQEADTWGYIAPGTPQYAPDSHTYPTSSKAAIAADAPSPVSPQPHPATASTSPLKESPLGPSGDHAVAATAEVHSPQIDDRAGAAVNGHANGGGVQRPSTPPRTSPSSQVVPSPAASPSLQQGLPGSHLSTADNTGEFSTVSLADHPLLPTPASTPISSPAAATPTPQYASPPAPSPPQLPPRPPIPPADSIRLLSRHLATLRTVLAPILQAEEVQYIFGRVASLYSETLSGTLDLLQPKGDVAEWEAHRKANTLFILQCFSELPLDPSRSNSYLSRLSTFYSKHYGLLPQAALTSAGTMTAK